jgi:hypothetical protein
MPQIYDMGPTVYFPSEGRRTEDFFALKKPTASAGFEPANLGTKDQHATSRPPKLMTAVLNTKSDPRNNGYLCDVLAKIGDFDKPFLSTSISLTILKGSILII